MAVRTLSIELAAVKVTLQLTDNNFVHFHSEEQMYLMSLKEPPAQDQLKIHYVDVLEELEEHR